MGGNVGIIIKKENGEQIGMSRWTNVMPYFFSKIELYSGEHDKWFEEFSAEWLAMKADYEKNKDTGQYEFNMTDVYFPTNNLSPDEYGIIAVDFKNKKIYSSQDYCHIGSISLHNIWNSSDDNQENMELLTQYFNKSFIKEIKYYDYESKSHQTINIESLKIEDVFQLLEEMSNYKTKTFSHPLFSDFIKEDFDLFNTSFVLDTDWKFTTFQDRTVGVLKVRKEMVDDGFIFSTEDDNAWKNYLSYRWSNSDESELAADKDYQEFKTLYLQAFNEPFPKQESTVSLKP